MTLRSFLAGCWFSHGNQIRERRGKSYVLVCESCGDVLPFLSKQKLRVKKVKPLTLVKPSKVIGGRFQ